MSTNMRTPFSSSTKSPSRDCSSMLRLYWNPEHPPGTTLTRSPDVSGRPSSLAINFLISAAAGSVTMSVIAGAAGTAVVSLGTVCVDISDNSLTLSQIDNRRFILLTFTQNNKFGFHRFNRHLARNLLSHVAKRFGLGGIGVADDHRHALITTFPHVNAQGNRPQKGHVVSAGKLLPAPFTEDVVSCARVGSDEVTHILDYAEHWYGDCLKHSQGPAHIGNRYVLRCGNQNCA